MTQPDALHTQLRAEIHRRLAVARAATPGPWWDSAVRAAPGHHTIRGGPDDWRGFDGSLGGDTRPVARIEPAPDEEGEFVTNHDADAAFIATFNPAAVIAWLEGELETLEWHYPVGEGEWCAGQHLMSRLSDCPEIRSLAHRLGVSVDGR